MTDHALIRQRPGGTSCEYPVLPGGPRPGRLCVVKTNDPRPCNRTADHFFVAGTGFEPVTSGL